MSVTAAVGLLGIGVLFVLIRLFHLTMPGIPPILHFTDSVFNRAILAQCPRLLQPYIPTTLWGRSGHIQTILYGKMGRINSPFPRGDRHSTVLADGATATFDLFQQINTHPSGGDYTLVVCPGIANSSESVYIRTYVHYAQEQGYRLAVLNHLGAIKNSPLTAPRIFTYGGTDEYDVMVQQVSALYPHSLLIAVGFSMGGNIIIKYLGEKPERQSMFIGAISCCQGYDLQEIAPYLLSWNHLRRMYVWAMTQHQKGIIRRHRSMLFGEEAVKRYGSFDENRLFSATSLYEVDRCYSHRRAGFTSCEEYYKWSSSRHYMNEIHIPTFILNAFDDPLVPPELHYIPRHLAMNRDNVIFAVTRHGGHLGYFEKGLIIPDKVTWLDKIVIDYADALVNNVRNFRKEQQQLLVNEI